MDTNTNTSIGGFTLQNLGTTPKPSTARKSRLTLDSGESFDRRRSAVSAAVDEWVGKMPKEKKKEGVNGLCSPSSYAYVKEVSPDKVVFECHHAGAEQYYIAGYRIDSGTGKALLNEPQLAKNTWTVA